MLWAKHTCVPSTVNIKPWLREKTCDSETDLPKYTHTHWNLLSYANWLTGLGKNKKANKPWTSLCTLYVLARWEITVGDSTHPWKVLDNCRWFDPSMKDTVSRWARLWLTVYAQHGCFLQKPSQNELWLAWPPLLFIMRHLCYGQDYSVLLWCCRGAGELTETGF